MTSPPFFRRSQEVSVSPVRKVDKSSREKMVRADNGTASMVTATYNPQIKHKSGGMSFQSSYT